MPASSDRFPFHWFLVLDRARFSFRRNILTVTGFARVQTHRAQQTVRPQPTRRISSIRSYRMREQVLPLALLGRAAENGFALRELLLH